MTENLRDAALEYHRQPTHGKISVVPTKAMVTQRDLSLAYSPGVAEACNEIVRDPREAVRGAHVVTTDVWASMGQEEEQALRERAFAGYTVDAALMAQAASDAIFLHCLPAHLSLIHI